MASTLQDRIEEKLLEKRIIKLSRAVESESVERIIERALYLSYQDDKAPIHFLINSPGGSVTDGFALFDILDAIPNPINTLVAGLAASMGSILHLAGGKGRRFALPNARIMIHQPRMGGSQGQATDLQITAEEILKTRHVLVKLYVKLTGKSEKEIEKAIDRDLWLDAKAALEFGLIDKIIHSLDELPNK